MTESQYLCDTCANNVIDVWLETCHCRAYGMEHVEKRVDDGRDLREVCEHYEPREAQT